MAQLRKKSIDFGTGSGQVNSRDLPANFTPTNYTPSQVSSEGTDKVSAHLKGIDTALSASSGFDIPSTTFAAANNQASFTNVTGLVLNASVKSCRIIFDIELDATADLYEQRILDIKKMSSDYSVVESFVGDNSLVELDITSGGQVQYKSDNYSGFTTLTFKYRVYTVS